MNSFNHYAYGSVFDWIFGDMMGIKVPDDGAGYKKVVLAPIPEKRIGFAEAELETRCGKYFVSWRYVGDKVRYEFTVPKGASATIRIAGMDDKEVLGGSYTIVK
jgi:alpha-L-rhamnosidase